jgi:hypothetical protein
VDLNPNAKKIAEELKSGSAQFSSEELRELAETIPKDLTPTQLKQLMDRLAKVKASGEADPYEIIGQLAEEIERIKRGGADEPVEVEINGKRRPDLSTPGTPGTAGDQGAAGQGPGGQPGGQTGAQQGEHSGAQPGTQTGTKGGKPGAPGPAAQPKKKGGALGQQPTKVAPPKSLMPGNLPEHLAYWDESKNAYEWNEGAKARLENVYELDDGLGVGIENATLTSTPKPDGVLFELEFDVFVFDLPRGAGKDYPWQLGDREHHSISAFRDTTGKVTALETVSSSIFASAFDITETKVVPKAHAPDVNVSGATVHVAGMKGDTIKKIQGVTYHYVTVLLVPTRVTNPDALMVDIDGRVIHFTQGVEVEAREAFAVPE